MMKKKKGAKGAGWEVTRRAKKRRNQNGKLIFSGTLMATLLLSVSLVGTLAWLTYTDGMQATNAMSIGRAKITIQEPGVNQNSVQWSSSAKPVQVRLDSGADQVRSFIRVMIVPVLKDGDGLRAGPLGSLSAPSGQVMNLGNIDLHFVSGWTTNWFYRDGFFYYRSAVEPGSTTTQLLSGATMKNGDAVNAQAFQDNTVTITVISESIQAAGNAAADAWGVTVSGSTIS